MQKRNTTHFGPNTFLKCFQMRVMKLKFLTESDIYITYHSRLLRPVRSSTAHSPSTFTPSRSLASRAFENGRPPLVESLWDLPPGLRGIVGKIQTLHTLATYRGLRLYHTPPRNLEFTLPSEIVAIHGDFQFHVRVFRYSCRAGR